MYELLILKCGNSQLSLILYSPNQFKLKSSLISNMKYFLRRSILTLNKMTADFKRSSFVLTDWAFSFPVAGTIINTLVFTSCNAVSNGVESVVVIFICHCQCIRGRETWGLDWAIAPPDTFFADYVYFYMLAYIARKHVQKCALDSVVQH